VRTVPACAPARAIIGQYLRGTRVVPDSGTGCFGSGSKRSCGADPREGGRRKGPTA
jgi:hypothetical protein